MPSTSHSHCGTCIKSGSTSWINIVRRCRESWSDARWICDPPCPNPPKPINTPVWRPYPITPSSPFSFYLVGPGGCSADRRSQQHRVLFTDTDERGGGLCSGRTSLPHIPTTETQAQSRDACPTSQVSPSVVLPDKPTLERLPLRFIDKSQALKGRETPG